MANGASRVKPLDLISNTFDRARAHRLHEIVREVALPRARLRRSAALFAHARALPVGGVLWLGAFGGLPRFTAVYPFLDAQTASVKL